MWVEKNGKTWRIRDMIAGQKATLGSGYPTKTAAKNAMTKLKADQLDGKMVNPKAGEITLNEWLDIWWPTKKASLKESSAYKEAQRLRLHVRPVLGEFKLNEIDRLVVAAWVATLLEPDEDLDGRKPLSAKTIGCCHGLLHGALKAAVEAKRIPENPAYRTGLPEIVKYEMRFLSEAETARLLTAVPRHYRPLVLLLVATGLRIGEALALRVKDVDVLARKLTVRKTLSEVAGELIETTPKSKMSRRTVTYTTSVAEALTPLVAGRDREEHLFLAVQGGQLRWSRVWKMWTKAVDRAGLQGVRIHDLRHTHAATLIADNISPAAIQRRLGHSSITVTMDVYGHLMPVVDDNITAATDRFLSLIDFRGILGESTPETDGDQLRSTDVMAGQAA